MPCRSLSRWGSPARAFDGEGRLKDKGAEKAVVEVGVALGRTAARLQRAAS